MLWKQKQNNLLTFDYDSSRVRCSVEAEKIKLSSCLRRGWVKPVFINLFTSTHAGEGCVDLMLGIFLWKSPLPNLNISMTWYMIFFCITLNSIRMNYRVGAMPECVKY